MAVANTITIYDDQGNPTTYDLKDNISGYQTRTQIQTLLEDYVTKEAGKGLSTNDYTTTEKAKLSGIETDAQKNVQSDWNATSGDSYIKNKPSIPSPITVDSELSNNSTNPVQNKVINTALGNKSASTHTHGNVTNAGAITATGVTIANGDAIVITDSSASGKLVKTSITFDGSTTNKYLSQKGTWETLPASISYEVVGNL